MRLMMNCAVGREYLDRTPFRRGTETLIRKLREGGAADMNTNSQDDQGLEIWLGGRDSNPDNVVQSHVSYR